MSEGYRLVVLGIVGLCFRRIELSFGSRSLAEDAAGRSGIAGRSPVVVVNAECTSCAYAVVGQGMDLAARHGGGLARVAKERFVSRQTLGQGDILTTSSEVVARLRSEHAVAGEISQTSAAWEACCPTVGESGRLLRGLHIVVRLIGVG